MGSNLGSNIVSAFNKINRIRYTYDIINDISIIGMLIIFYLCWVALQNYY